MPPLPLTSAGGSKLGPYVSIALNYMNALKFNEPRLVLTAHGNSFIGMCTQTVPDRSLRRFTWGASLLAAGVSGCSIQG